MLTLPLAVSCLAAQAGLHHMSGEMPGEMSGAMSDMTGAATTHEHDHMPCCPEPSPDSAPARVDPCCAVAELLQRAELTPPVVQKVTLASITSTALAALPALSLAMADADAAIAATRLSARTDVAGTDPSDARPDPLDLASVLLI